MDAPAPQDPRVAWVSQLLSADGVTDLARVELDAWIASGHTNAADLLAARQLGGGSEFLLRAL